jgi:purine-binding chemotaxis protein CheW
LKTHLADGRARIDWEQVRERLPANERATAEALSANPERAAALYRKRAVQLAKPPSGQEAKAAGTPVMIFYLHQECYAIALDALAEVLPFTGCTPVPGAAAKFLGVIHVRGELRPLVDLSRMLLRTADSMPTAGFVLMLRQPGSEIGLKVGRTTGLQYVPPESLRSSVEGKYVKQIAGETTLWLDVEKLLADVFPKEEL